MIFNSRLIFMSVIYFLFICNFYYYFHILIFNRLDDAFDGYNVTSISSVHLSFLLVSLFYIVIYYLCSVSLRLKPIFLLDDISLKKQNFLAKIVLLGLIILFLGVISEGVGTAGGENTADKTIFSTLLALFRFDYLAIIFLMTFPKAKIFYIIFFLYFIISILQGWLGGIIVLGIIYLIKMELRVKDVFFSKFSLVGLLLVFLMPSLMEARHLYRFDNDFSFVLNYDFSFAVFIDSLHLILSRFQQVETLTYFFDNYDYFYSIYSANITPIFFEGIIPNKLYEFFTDKNTQSLGYMLFENSHDIVYGRKSALIGGVIPHIFLSAYTLIYILFVFFATMFFSTLFSISSNARFVLIYHVLMLFSFGWSNAFFSFFFAYVIFVIMVIFISNMKINRY